MAPRRPSLGLSQQRLGEPGAGPGVGRAGPPGSGGQCQVGAGRLRAALGQGQPAREHPGLQRGDGPAGGLELDRAGAHPADRDGRERLGRPLWSVVRVAGGGDVGLQLGPPGQRQPLRAAEPGEGPCGVGGRRPCGVEVVVEQGGGRQQQLRLRQVHLALAGRERRHGRLGVLPGLGDQAHREQQGRAVDQQGPFLQPHPAVAGRGRVEVLERGGDVAAAGEHAPEVLLHVGLGQGQPVVGAQLLRAHQVGLGGGELPSGAEHDAAVGQGAGLPRGVAGPSQHRQCPTQVLECLVDATDLLQDRGPLDAGPRRTDPGQLVQCRLDRGDGLRRRAAQHQCRGEAHVCLGAELWARRPAGRGDRAAQPRHRDVQPVALHRGHAGGPPGDTDGSPVADRLRVPLGSQAGLLGQVRADGGQAQRLGGPRRRVVVDRRGHLGSGRLARRAAGRTVGVGAQRKRRSLTNGA